MYAYFAKFRLSLTYNLCLCILASSPPFGALFKKDWIWKALPSYSSKTFKPLKRTEGACTKLSSVQGVRAAHCLRALN